MCQKNDLDNMDEGMALVSSVLSVNLKMLRHNFICIFNIKARQDMGAVTKDLLNIQKVITSLEANIKKKKWNPQHFK